MQNSRAQSEQGEAGSAAWHTSKGAGHKIERAVWIVLLVLPLLAYCVVAVLAYSIKPTPINTGDALYDKYLAWVADDLANNYRGSIAKPYGNRWGSAGYSVNLDPFASWEAEFGNDPRYWMLRYRHSMGTRIDEWGFSEFNISYLEQAYELGVVDGAILFILLKEMDSNFSNESDYNSTNIPHSPKAAADYQKFKRSEIDRQVGTEHNQLLAELLEVAGDESLPHYYAALCDGQRGNYEQAFLHLSEGNQAPNNSSLIGFPIERVSLDLRSATPLPDKLISGLILGEEVALLLPDFIEIKNLGKVLVSDAVSRNDRAALDEFHTFACRYGGLGGGSVMTHLVGTVLVGQVESEFSNNLGSSLNAQQTSNLATLTNLKGQQKI